MTQTHHQTDDFSMLVLVTSSMEIEEKNSWKNFDWSWLLFFNHHHKTYTHATGPHNRRSILWLNSRTETWNVRFKRERSCSILIIIRNKKKHWQGRLVRFDWLVRTVIEFRLALYLLIHSIFMSNWWIDEGSDLTMFMYLK